MASSFHSLTVSSVVPEGQTAKAIGFRLPDELRETFRFVPGQYLTLKAEIDGEEVRRSYSICSMTPNCGSESKRSTAAGSRPLPRHWRRATALRSCRPRAASPPSPAR